MKNLLIIGLIGVVILETGYIAKLKLRGDSEENRERPVVAMQSTAPSPRANGERPPMPPVKGDALANSAVAKSAFEVYPTVDDSVAAKASLVGWTIKPVKNKDGSATVSLVPKNPSDPTSSYTVKAGQKLYFVEMSTGDDKANTDEDANLRDDYGIITDAAGIVQ